MHIESTAAAGGAAAARCVGRRRCPLWDPAHAWRCAEGRLRSSAQLRCDRLQQRRRPSRTPGAGPSATRPIRACSALLAPAGQVVGLDIGCGANLVYPLLGASLCGWRFVGADVTDVALSWAARNLGANPRLGPLIELRRVARQPEQQALLAEAGGDGGAAEQQAAAAGLEGTPPAVASAAPAPVVRLSPAEAAGGGIVSGAVRHGERLAFCMCNPPFFESIEAAGRNPATAFGGTADEMVYPGAAAGGRLLADSFDHTVLSALPPAHYTGSLAAPPPTPARPPAQATRHPAAATCHPPTHPPARPLQAASWRL